MNLLHSVRHWLALPYPPPESFQQDIKGVVTGAIIVTTILYVFRPFGLSYYQGSVFWISMLFGGVTLVAGTLYLLFLRFLLTPMSYQATYYLGKWVAEILGLILVIAIGNWCTIVWMNQGGVNVSSFLTALIVTFVIGVIPVVIFGLQNQIKQERRNAATAIELASQIESNPKEKMSQPNMVLAIQAMENYIIVYSLEKEDVNKASFRRTLKSAQEDVSYKSLIKCHRSYLINPEAIKEVEGNAQGLRLNLGYPDCPIIPVSRSYIPKVRALLS